MIFHHLTPSQREERAFEIAAQARKAPYYAHKHGSLSLPHDSQSWLRLPVLERQEVFDHAYPRSTDMLTQAVEGMIILSTGGSSGVARYTLMTHQEWDGFVEVQAQAIRNLGVGPADRVANLFLAGHLWPSFLGVHDALARAGAVHVPISGNLPLPEMARLCQEFDVTVMLSLPTCFIFLADLALKEGYKFPSLRLIGFGGEQLSQQAQNHLRRSLGVREIKAVGYSSADCGLMGYACMQCPFATYHLPAAFQYLEIVDETGQPCPPGQQGELLVTNLGRTSMPMVRYRIGDVGWWLDGPCPCGDPNPLFTLAGRAGDDFKLGGAYISMAAFEEALGPLVPPLSLNFQIELEDVGGQMEIRLAVECADQKQARDAEAALREGVVQRVPEIGVGLEKDFIRKFEVRFHELGTLPRQPITGKVKRLRDLRVS